MTRSKLLKTLRSELGDYKFFQFDHTEYSYILLGYPHLRGFISAADADFWIEVLPEINLSIPEIIFPQNLSRGKKNRAIEKADSILRQNTSLLVESPEFQEEQNKFFATFPADLLTRICSYNDSHFELIKASSLFGDYFITLLKRDPIIAYLMVNMDKFNLSFTFYNHLSFLEILLPRKRKEILSLAQFPGTQAMLNILVKFHPSHLRIDSLITFRNVMRMDPDIKKQTFKVLAHFKNYNEKLLKLISEAPYSFNILTIHSINKLIHSEDFPKLARSIGNIVSLSQRWNIKVAPINNIKNINEIEANIKMKALGRFSDLNKFPAPPLPDNQNIIALRTIKEQTSWAKRQQNCIRGYIPAVKSNKCYFYKVISGDEEATLEIRLKKGVTQLGDIRGFRNNSVSPQLRQLTEDWFKEYAI